MVDSEIGRVKCELLLASSLLKFNSCSSGYFHLSRTRGSRKTTALMNPCKLDIIGSRVMLMKLLGYYPPNMMGSSIHITFEMVTLVRAGMSFCYITPLPCCTV